MSFFRRMLMNKIYFVVLAALGLAVALEVVLTVPRGALAEGGDAPALAVIDPVEGSGSAAGTARLAIIIDDFGQGREGVKEMMGISRKLTFAVMPFCDFTKRDADDGYLKGFEIIVHLPMEPLHGQPSWVGTNPILCSLDDDKIRSVTKMSFEDVPHAVGANVHMGSKASADERVMRDILGEASRAGFFFVDSRTGPTTVIGSVAKDLNVPSLPRDVFLDGHQPKSYVIGQLRAAESIALKRGYAIAIGHVGSEGGSGTAEAIKEMLPELDEKGVQLVFVSELFGSGGPLAVQKG